MMHDDVEPRKEFGRNCARWHSTAFCPVGRAPVLYIVVLFYLFLNIIIDIYLYLGSHNFSISIAFFVFV